METIEQLKRQVESLQDQLRQQEKNGYIGFAYGRNRTRDT